ncbi:hypothetical protein PIB30_076151 [Stylosanthes scabra]|uniref:Uncharacterized protein n=1 Tax=Stylosanthes scabra TaxID=79078 RepID=A0ABU6WNG8_9FABA|nr:hypothetical protein [Stylosanthes scabra]
MANVSSNCMELPLKGYTVGSSCAETRAVNLIDGPVQNEPNHKITKLPPVSGYKREAQPFFPSFHVEIERKLTENRFRTILNPFSTVHRRLLVAITFDLELRLMHRLRLREAYHLLYASNLGLSLLLSRASRLQCQNRIGRARSSLVILLETKKLMVVLGCSKSGGTAFGIPSSVGIQVRFRIR